VDDNIDHLTIFQEGLERYGFTVKGYFSPLKALEEFHPGLYDVAIVNVMMHAMNGKDLSKNLTHFDNTIKLILLTPANEDDKEINTGTSNHFWIIRKPITIKNLSEELISIMALEENIPLL
jgi:two-component system capsular synthesis sensor histidine kinase RcsC